MQNNALWLVLVMILGASVLVLVLPDDEAVSVNEDDTKDDTEEETVEESTCLVGTQKVLNASAENGFDLCLWTHIPCFTRTPLPY